MHWYDKGKNHVWLPYTQMQFASPQLKAKSAKGVYIYTHDGNKLIDGISSWWSMAHGHNHPKIIEAIKTQADKFSHVMFAGIANEPAYLLAEKLAKITPKGLEKVFFSDSGSTAVEVALKMAVQYYKNQGFEYKDRFLCFASSYHGDTMGAMSVSDHKNGMHQIYSSYMPEQYMLKIPNDEYSLQEFEETVKALKDNIAAIIMEPLVQGAGGLKFYSADILAAIYKIAKENNILFIADEVMTGFGRTGSMFAVEEAGFTPDIICLGKAITGGAMTLGATIATDEIFEMFLGNALEKALMHGPTFMGNALACSASLASVNLFDDGKRLEQIANIESYFEKNLPKFLQYKQVESIRSKGAIGVIELKETNWQKNFAMRELFIKKGVWLRPFANVIYVMPPFIITEDELEKVLQAIEFVLKEIYSNSKLS